MMPVRWVWLNFTKNFFECLRESISWVNIFSSEYYRQERKSIERKRSQEWLQWRQQTPRDYLKVLIFYRTSTWLKLMESFHIISVSFSLVGCDAMRSPPFFFHSFPPFSHQHTGFSNISSLTRNTETHNSSNKSIVCFSLNRCSLLIVDSKS